MSSSCEHHLPQLSHTFSTFPSFIHFSWLSGDWLTQTLLAERNKKQVAEGTLVHQLCASDVFLRLAGDCLLRRQAQGKNMLFSFPVCTEFGFPSRLQPASLVQHPIQHRCKFGTTFRKCLFFFRTRSGNAFCKTLCKEDCVC
jgi:hypothetical protein